jgi:hypothetical protein
MNLDIAHMAVSLQGLSPELGARVTELLGPALQRRLSGLGPHGGSSGSGGSGARDAARDIAHVDLGVIEAPAGADPRALSELIAAQLLGWIEREAR